MRSCCSGRISRSEWPIQGSLEQKQKVVPARQMRVRYAGEPCVYCGRMLTFKPKQRPGGAWTKVIWCAFCRYEVGDAGN
jgi:hypothetical protein